MLVGRIGRAVGLKGDVEIAVASDAPERFAVGAVVLLAESLRPMTIERSRPTSQARSPSAVGSNKERFIVAFTEVTDRTGAEALTGTELVIPVTDARDLEEGEYWDHDLIGCLVVDTDGHELGMVDDVLHQPSGSLLVVRAGGKEHLVPLVGDIVKDVQPRDRITIDPIPGLFGD